MYDFTTVLSRKGKGSSKWNMMYADAPELEEGIVPLSVADMEFRNAPEIIHGLQEFLQDAVLGYTMPTKEYMDAVIGWMKRRHGFQVDESWIVNTSGVVPALFTAVRAYTNPGDGVIVCPPVYYPFYSSVEAQGRVVVRVPLVEENNLYSMDFEKLEEAAKDPKNKMFLFCTPHNPVGRVWTEEELEKVAEICLKNDVLVVADEIHHDLILPGHTHRVFHTLSPEVAARTITCTAASKTFNIAGMKNSNIIISDEKLREVFVEEQERSADKSVGILSLKATQLAYEHGEAWLEELLTVIDKNRQTVCDFFEKKIPEIRTTPLEGTYLLWIDFRALGMSHRELERFMTKEAKIYFDEGFWFGKEGRGFERINLAAPTQVISDALERLERALKRLKES